MPLCLQQPEWSRNKVTVRELVVGEIIFIEW